MYKKLGLYRYSLLGKIIVLAVVSFLLTWIAYVSYSGKVKEGIFEEGANDVALMALNVKSNPDFLKVFNGFNSISKMQVHLVSENPASRESVPVGIEKKYIDYFKNHRSKSYVVVSYKGNFYYLMPLYATTSCLTCHGKKVDPKTYALLKEKYGEAYERTVGHSKGELLGLLSISEAKDEIKGVSLPVTAIVTYLAGWVLFLLGFYYLVVKRITALRDVLRQVTKGKLDVKVGVEDLQGVNVADEITQVEQDVVKLKNSIQIALKRRRK